MFGDIFSKIVAFVDTLTIFDITLCCVVYLVLSIFIANIWTKFQFIDFGEYINIFIVTMITGTMVCLYFFENKYFLEIRNNNLLALLFCISGLLLLFSFIVRIFFEEEEETNLQPALALAQTEGLDKKLNTQQNWSYNNYDYYYNKEDKYAEPHTTEAHNKNQENTHNISKEVEKKVENEVGTINTELKKEIKESIESDFLQQQKINQSLNLLDMNNKNIEIKYNNLQDKVKELQDKLNLLEIKSTEERRQAFEMLNQKLQYQKDKNNEIREKSKEDINNIKQELNNVKNSINSINDNVIFVRNENNDYMTKRLLADKHINEQLQKAVSETTKTQEKVDLTNEKIEKIIADKKQDVESIKQTNNDFGSKLEEQLLKMTNILEENKRKEEEKIQKELIKQQIISELKQKEAVDSFDKELEKINQQYKEKLEDIKQENQNNAWTENNINSDTNKNTNIDEQETKNYYAMEEQQDNIKKDALCENDKDLLEDVKLNEIVSFAEENKSITSTAKDNVLIQESDGDEIIAKDSFDAIKFEENILEKVKTMLKDNNDSIDEKFGMVSADVGNLRDGVQGMVDRMTKVFELLTVALQKNNN